MLKKAAPLFFIILSCVCIKLSSDANVQTYDAEPLNVELAGLKIKTSIRQPAAEAQSIETVQTPTVKVQAETQKCEPLKNLKELEDSFSSTNQEALKKALGPWYMEKSENLKYDYQLFNGLSKSALYATGVYALEKSPSPNSKEKDKPNPNLYLATNVLYSVFYRDNSNSDALFYIYDQYKKTKAAPSSYEYLKGKMSEPLNHKPLNSQVYKSVLKLAKDPESLMGAYQILQNFTGLSSMNYKTPLLETKKESRISIAKKMIKQGADKTAINSGLEWSPAAYQAAYTILEDEDLARPYLPLSELKKDKADSNRSFMDKLATVKTNCELEEAWEIAASVVRELQ